MTKLTIITIKLNNVAGLRKSMNTIACGTPVVAFNIGGNSDMIDHKLNGYLAKASDTEDLAQGINYCLNNNTDNTFSVVAREKIVGNFKQMVVANSYVEFYNKIKLYSDEK